MTIILSLVLTDLLRPSRVLFPLAVGDVVDVLTDKHDDDKQQYHHRTCNDYSLHHSYFLHRFICAPTPM